MANGCFQIAGNARTVIYFNSCDKKEMVCRKGEEEDMILEIIGILIGAAAVFCLLVSAVDCNRFVVREYEVSSAKLTRPCTMLLLSDLHNKTYGFKNRKLLDKIEELAPDALLLAGDMLTAQKGEEFSPALELVEELARKYKIYYGMGNHEYRLKLYPQQYGNVYEEYLGGLKKAGVSPLINENLRLPFCNASVCGSEIDRCYYKRFRKHPMNPDYLERLLGKASEDSFQILIAHNPDYFEEYAAWGADLVVSGHVHGGIMRLPFLGGVLSPNLSLFPRYDGGEFQEGSSTMILSRGLGTHTLPLRIFNPGELVRIKLIPAK